jgi:hypothetical protein
MDSSNLKSMFIDCLSARFMKEDFKFIKNRSAFVRKTEFGEQWYTLTFLKYSGQDGFEINPGIHVRFEEVEKFYHQTSAFSKQEQKGTSTIGCSIENYKNDSTDLYRCAIVKGNDISIACDFIYDQYINIAKPFYQLYNSLENLYELINSKPNKELAIINPIFRGIKGVIIANLLNHETLDLLIKSYSQQYEIFYNGFYKPDFDKVVENILKQC